MKSCKQIVAATPALALAAGLGAALACPGPARDEGAASQSAPAASQPSQPATQPIANVTTHPAVSKQQDDYQGMPVFIAGQRR
jgi:hypothetical protein